MIVLNAGQKAMSMRHQVELLFTSLKETLIEKVPGLELLSERDKARRTKSNKYPLGDVASAYQAFMTKSTEIDKANVVADALTKDGVLDSSEAELTKKFDSFVVYFNRLKLVDEALWVLYSEADYPAQLKTLRGDPDSSASDINRLLALSKANLWLGKESALLAVFCAIASFIDTSKQERVDAALDKLLERVGSGDPDPLGIVKYEEIKAVIDPRKYNVGFATRRLLLNGFKEFFRDEGDTPMDECWVMAAD